MSNTVHTILAAALALTACGKNDKAATDWSKLPLDATIESKVKGAAFRLSIPKGWTFNATGSDTESNPDLFTKEWFPGPGDYYGKRRCRSRFRRSRRRHWISS